MLLLILPWTKVRTEPVLFYLPVFGFFIGVAGLSAFPNFVNLSASFFILFIACVSFIFWRRQSLRYFLYITVFGLFLFLGVLRALFFFENISLLPDSYIGQKAILSGRVLGQAEKKENSVRFIFEAEEISGQPLKEKVRLLVFATPEAEAFRGQILQVSGLLKKPEMFLPSSSQVPFDWPDYLKAKKILYILSFAKIEKKSEGGKNLLFYFDQVKKIFSEKIEKVLPKPEASFLLGTLIGKDPASRETEDSFKKAGLLHILVLSGYNIAIIIWAVISFFHFLSRRQALVLGIISAFLFMLLVGPTAPLLRAFIMAFCAILAELLGGAASARRTAWLAAFLIVLASPGLLLFDPSFQLSFLATLGLVYGPLFLKNKAVFNKIPLLVREITISSLSAQFFVLPALLFYTGSVTPYFLLANILILPLVPIIMFFGFMLGILVFVLPPASFLALAPLFLLLKISLFVISFISRLPGSLFFIGSFSGVLIFTLYSVLFVLCVKRAEYPQKSSLVLLSSIKRL